MHAQGRGHVYHPQVVATVTLSPTTTHATGGTMDHNCLAAPVGTSSTRQQTHPRPFFGQYFVSAPTAALLTATAGPAAAAVLISGRSGMPDRGGRPRQQDDGSASLEGGGVDKSSNHCAINNNANTLGGRRLSLQQVLCS